MCERFDEADLSLFWQNELHRVYNPENVGLRYTLVRNPVSDFSTKTSRNGNELFSSFSNVKCRAV